MSRPSRLEQLGHLLTAAIAVMLVGDSGLQRKPGRARQKVARAIYNKSGRNNRFHFLVECGVCSQQEMEDCRRGFSDDQRIRAALHLAETSVCLWGLGYGSDSWLRSALAHFVPPENRPQPFAEGELERDMAQIRRVFDDPKAFLDGGETLSPFAKAIVKGICEIRLKRAGGAE